jgi:hypothetical protein
MVKARIRPGVRGLDAKVINDDLTITKNWTTVADDAVEGLLRYQYKGSPVIEVDVPPVVVDEAPTDFFIADEDHDTEDESDGTE